MTGTHPCLVALCAIVVGSSALVAQAATAPAPAASYRNRLLGVFDAQSGEAIEGASVTDIVEHVTALTTKTGTITLAFLPDGGSIVRIQKVGYKPATLMAAISPDDTLPITVMLISATTTLPTVVTTDSMPHHRSPGLQAFEERRKAGFGVFLTEPELRKQDGHLMSDAVRGLGVNVLCTLRTPIACYAVSSRQGSKQALSPGRCDFDVYIDGVRSTERNLDAIIIDQIGAVEAYKGPATIPLQYNATGSSCGVLLFWTRER